MSWECWTKGVDVEPSIYAGDFARLDEQPQALLDAGARIFHFDSATVISSTRSRSVRSC